MDPRTMFAEIPEASITRSDLLLDGKAATKPRKQPQSSLY